MTTLGGEDIWGDQGVSDHIFYSILTSHSLWETGLYGVLEFVMSCAQSIAVMKHGWRIMEWMEETSRVWKDHVWRRLAFAYTIHLLLLFTLTKIESEEDVYLGAVF